MARSVYKSGQFELAESWRIEAASPPEEPVVEPEPPDEEDPSPQAEQLLAAAQEHALQIINAARREAESLLEDAKKAALQSELDAYESGKEQGYLAGREAGLESLEQLADLVDSARIDWESMVRDSERQIVDLALTIAGRVASRIAERDKAFVLASVMQALDHLAESPTVKVRVHPDDYELLTTHWQETRGLRYRDRDWTFLADAGIERGGCVLDLENGHIDAQLSTQLTEIGRALRATGGFDDRDG